VIVCGLNYNTAHPYSIEAAACDGGVSRVLDFALRVGRDYHEVLWERLNALSAALRERFPEPHDPERMPTRAPSRSACSRIRGLGWLGKNTLLLNEKMGSWFFLGVIFSTLELSASLAHTKCRPQISAVTAGSAWTLARPGPR